MGRITVEDTISNLELNIRWIEDNPAHQFAGYGNVVMAMRDALELLKERETPILTIDDAVSKLMDRHYDRLKEQEKKQITLHKKHVVTWNRNDMFSMRNLYEAICEELLDEGELFIARTDDHEKVDFVFYVTEGR